MARRFRMNFEMVNAAFDEGAAGDEVARILREAADKAADGRDEGIVYDINGNAIGRWRVSAR